MSHPVYLLIFLLLSASVAAVLQARTKQEFVKYFTHRFFIPIVAVAGFSWLMFFLHKL